MCCEASTHRSTLTITEYAPPMRSLTRSQFVGFYYQLCYLCTAQNSLRVGLQAKIKRQETSVQFIRAVNSMVYD